MREILFRAQDIKTKEWRYGFLTKIRGVLHIIDKDNENIAYPIVPETVGQFTGLTDENGKKIFEGDIIRYANFYDYNCYLESIDNTEVYDGIDLGNIWTVDKVVYGINDGYPAFDLNKNDFECNGLCELKESQQFFYEVIGNIYDNKEILEDKE